LLIYITVSSKPSNFGRGGWFLQTRKFASPDFIVARGEKIEKTPLGNNLFVCRTTAAEEHFPPAWLRQLRSSCSNAARGEKGIQMNFVQPAVSQQLPPQPVRTEDSVQSRPSLLTYESLTELFCRHWHNERKSRQKLKNVRTALKSWREAHQIAPKSTIGREFNDEFALHSGAYRHKQLGQGLQKSTVDSRLSLIKAARSFYLRARQFDELPSSFGARITLLLNNCGCRPKVFWRMYLSEHISYVTWLKWTKDKVAPKATYTWLFSFIESQLDSPPGTLVDTLPRRSRIPYRRGASAVQSSSFALKLKVMQRKPYKLMTSQVKIELSDLEAFKTAVIPPRNFKRMQDGVWTSGISDEQQPPSAVLFRLRLGYFLGFCALPAEEADPMLRGRGLDPQKLSLAHLANCDLVEEYVTVFRKRRTGGYFTQDSLVFLSSVASLLRPGTGYLYQMPELGIRAGLAGSRAEWEERCARTRARLCELQACIRQEKKSGGSGFNLGRNPQEPIAELLRLKSPLAPLLEMVEEIRLDAARLRLGSIRQAILYRDALLLAMLLANPLRIRNYSQMELGRHLVKDLEGAWWIELKKKDIKNRRALKSDYRVRLESSLWAAIDEYLDKFRPLLIGDSKEIKNLFVCYKPKTRNQARAMSPYWLSEIVCLRSRQYLPSLLGGRNDGKANSGFRGHSFRHLVATDIIKAHPGVGFYLAAKILNDKVQTVEEYYAHLKTSDYHEPYNEHLAETWKAVRAARAARGV
jgi:hypothetical protein